MRGEVLSGLGAPKQVALQLVAVVVSQEVELLLGLDPLRHDRKAKAVRHRDDGVRQLGVVAVAGDFGHKAAIDLDAAKGEASQVAERGLARAKVVEREGNTHLGEPAEILVGLPILREDRGLGQLEFDLVRAHPHVLHQCLHLDGEVRHLKLCR